MGKIGDFYTHRSDQEGGSKDIFLARRTLEETSLKRHTIFRMYTIKVRVRASIRVRGEK